MTNTDSYTFNGHQSVTSPLAASMRTRMGGYQSPADGITFHIRPMTNKRPRLSPSSSFTEEMTPGSLDSSCLDALWGVPVKRMRPAMPPGTTFNDLPDDVLTLILVQLCKRASRAADLINAMLTCRRLCVLATQEAVLLHTGPAGLALPPSAWSQGAYRFLRKCAQAGSREAAFRLGMIKFYCLEDRRGGATLMARAAMGGHSDALHSLAIIHFNGSGGARSDRDLASGVILCAKAAAQGHVEALRELGHCLQDGYGLPRNVPEGRRLLLEANAREAAQWVCPGPLPPPRLHPEPPRWAKGVATAERRTNHLAGSSAPRSDRTNGNGATGTTSAEGRAATWRAANGGAAARGGVGQEGASGRRHESQGQRPSYVRTVSGPIASVPRLAGGGSSPAAHGVGLEGQRQGLTEAGEGKLGEVATGGCLPSGLPKGVGTTTDDEVGASGGLSRQQHPGELGSVVQVEVREAQPGRWLGIPEPKLPPQRPMASQQTRMVRGLPVYTLQAGEAEEAQAVAANGRPAQRAQAGGAGGPRQGGQGSGQLANAPPGRRPLEGYGVHGRSCADASRMAAALEGEAMRAFRQMAGPRRAAPPCCVLAGIGLLCGCHLADQQPSVQKFLVEWHRARELPEGLRLCFNARCGRLETRRQEFRCCSACGRAKYCSRACQAHDWKAGHKAACPVAALEGELVPLALA